MVAFNLLYLFVPAGWTPIHGFAPAIGGAYAGWPLPHLILVALRPQALLKTSINAQVITEMATLRATTTHVTFLLSALADAAVDCIMPVPVARPHARVPRPELSIH